MAIQWDDSGPTGGGRWLPLVRPGVGESLTVVCLSARIVGVWLHWIEGRTVPCVGEDEGCPYHEDDMAFGLRWKGYFAAVRSVGASIVFGEITQEAWRGAALLRALSSAGALRGVKIALHRRRGGPRRPVIVELPALDQTIARADLLPDPPDVRKAISVLWRGWTPPNGKPKPDKGEG